MIIGFEYPLKILYFRCVQLNLTLSFEFLELKKVEKQLSNIFLSSPKNIICKYL